MGKESDRASKSGREIWTQICLTLRPRLLSLPGTNSPMDPQPIQGKSASKSLPWFQNPYLYPVCPLTSLLPSPHSVCSRHNGLQVATQTCRLLSNHRAFALPVSPFWNICLWVDLFPPASRVLLKYSFIQKSKPSSSCHISHDLYFILCCLSSHVCHMCKGTLFCSHCL